MAFTVSIAVYLWLYSFWGRIWLIIGLFTVGIVVVPIAVPILIAECAEKRKHKRRFNPKETQQ